MDKTTAYIPVENEILLPTGMDFHDRVQYLAWRYDMTMVGFIRDKCQYRNPDRPDDDPTKSARSINVRLKDYTYRPRLDKEYLSNNTKFSSLINGMIEHCGEDGIPASWIWGDDEDSDRYAASHVLPEIPNMNSRTHYITAHIIPRNALLQRMGLSEKQMHDRISAYRKFNSRFFPYELAQVTNIPVQWITGEVNQCIIPEHSLEIIASESAMYENPDAIFCEVPPLQMPALDKLKFLAYRHGHTVLQYLMTDLQIPRNDALKIRNNATNDIWHPIIKKYTERIYLHEGCYLPKDFFTSHKVSIGSDLYNGLPPQIRDIYINMHKYAIFPRILNRKYRILWLIDSLHIDTMDHMIKLMGYSEYYFSRLMSDNRVTTNVCRMISIVYGVPYQWIAGDKPYACVRKDQIRWNGDRGSHKS